MSEEKMRDSQWQQAGWIASWLTRHAINLETGPFVELQDHLAAMQQEKSEDARMLEFVYSENYTSSNALVEIELRMLNGDFPTMEEVRKAIRAAISAQENKP